MLLQRTYFVKVLTNEVVLSVAWNPRRTPGMPGEWSACGYLGIPGIDRAVQELGMSE